MTENKQERITLENLSEKRKDLASLREQKGKSSEALLAADTLEGRLHEEVIDIIWEHYLIGKHMIMEAREKGGLLNLPFKAIKSMEGYFLMRSSAFRAQEYINEHGIETKRPRAGRFLGEVEMLIGNHKKAAKYFENSVSLFDKMSESSDRVNALELSGFLAEALILGGKTEKGIEIGTKTFGAYDVEDGLALKNRDYYTWAVWKSGCAIKVCNALVYKNIIIDGERKSLLMGMLEEAEKVVNPSPDIKVWGDFSLRKDEISALKGRLQEIN